MVRIFLRRKQARSFTLAKKHFASTEENDLETEALDLEAGNFDLTNVHDEHKRDKTHSDDSQEDSVPEAGMSSEAEKSNEAGKSNEAASNEAGTQKELGKANGKANEVGKPGEAGTKNDSETQNHEEFLKPRRELSAKVAAVLHCTELEELSDVEPVWKRRLRIVRSSSTAQTVESSAQTADSSELANEQLIEPLKKELATMLKKPQTHCIPQSPCQVTNSRARRPVETRDTTHPYENLNGRKSPTTRAIDFSCKALGFDDDDDDLSYTSSIVSRSTESLFTADTDSIGGLSYLEEKLEEGCRSGAAGLAEEFRKIAKNVLVQLNCNNKESDGRRLNADPEYHRTTPAGLRTGLHPNRIPGLDPCGPVMYPNIKLNSHLKFRGDLGSRTCLSGTGKFTSRIPRQSTR